MARKLPVSDFEGSLARKLCYHIFNFRILKEVLHECFASASSTFRFLGQSRTKASFPHLPLSDFERESRTKASFSHLQLSVFAGSLARNAF